MLRLQGHLWMIIAFLFFVSGLRADDKNAQDNKPQRGELSKIDSQGAGSLTVKLKDKDGKEVEKTFKLVRETKFYDADGKGTELNVFRAGDQVLLLRREGKVSELRQAGKPVQAEILNIDPSAGTVRVKMKDEDRQGGREELQAGGANPLHG